MKTFVIGIAACSLVSCGSISPTPKAETSKYMKMTGAGVITAEAPDPHAYKFFAWVTLLPGAPSPAYAQARFSNPVDPAKPFVVNGASTAKDPRSISLKTSPLSAPPESGLSQVSIDLYQDAAHRKQIDHLVQSFKIIPARTLNRLAADLPAANR